MRTLRKKRKRKVNIRLIVLFCIFAGIMLLFSARLVDFQLISASQYASSAGNTKVINKTIKAARGEILDRYGRPIVTNRDGYDIVFNYAEIDMSSINDTIKALTALLSESGTEWNDVLPLSKTFPVTFDGTDADIKTLKTRLDLNSYATEQNCYDELVSKYELDGLDREVQRTVMGVRYSMEKADFSIYTSYTFAEDISKQLVTYLEESYSNLDGVDVEIVPYRQYDDPTLAPHLIGLVSKITAEDWDEYKEKGYSYNDTVGSFGAEKSFEDYLHGKDGILSYNVNNEGVIVSSEVTKEPVRGDTVYLSIDKNLQKVAQQALSDAVNGADPSGSYITGASAVVTEVKTGQILAAANYPSFNLETYYDDIEKLQNDTKGSPLNNRAFSGMYPPGSCYKPLVAAVGLHLGKISRDEIITCKWRYTYYSENGPTCMHRHGGINLITALSKSCNYYFFEAGRRIGIENIDLYAKQFGLGVKTGKTGEIDESAGRLAGPEFSAKVGTSWYPGNTLQAAIGQSDNAFTPLQLSIYSATIANNGTRYTSTLLNKVKTYDLSSTVVNSEPEVAAKIDISESQFSIVKEGMLSVTEDGTARAYFSDYPIKVAGKTGTAENSGKDHSVFICFAPYDDPEISVSVVVEHGLNSSTTGPVAKAILNAYFFGTSEPQPDEKTGTLLP